MVANTANELTLTETTIPGLMILTLPVHGDNRGWFKESWQRQKMVTLGLPDFGPVQHNVSFNGPAGTTRGIHAEPWDKFISVASGLVFGAWVDLRAGDNFGCLVTAELDPATAVYVPRGVANSFQTLVDGTLYSYLVNDHWRPEALYTSLNLADETVAIDWPIGLDRAELSERDRSHPRLADVTPVPPRRTLILGADGQLGRALQAVFPEAEAASRTAFDLTDPAAYLNRNWHDYDTIINAAAYTNVDGAESIEGRRQAWLVNVSAVAELAKVALANDLTLVHVSSDYVFDGEIESHDVGEGFSPLGVYGQTKAAGDAIVSTVPKHYIVRTSWVIGAGHNFIATMERLADEGIEPSVVDDQIGRLTQASDVAVAIADLLAGSAAHGTYNVVGDGPVQSWFDIAQDVFETKGLSREAVKPISTADYSIGRAIAPRPRSSVLSTGDGGRP